MFDMNSSEPNIVVQQGTVKIGLLKTGQVNCTTFTFISFISC